MTSIKSRLLNGGTTELEKTVERIWALTVIMDQPGTALRFLFTTESLARGTYLGLCEAKSGKAAYEVDDEFGTTATIDGYKIIALNLADVHAEQDGLNEYNLICSIKQAELQRRAASDPRLQAGSKLLTPQIINMPPGRN